MYTKWPEGIVYLGVISEDFLREYCILLGKSMYKFFDAALLWIRLFAKYSVNECKLKRSKAES